MTSRIIDRDRGARRLATALDKIEDVRVSVGVHEEEGAQRHPSGPTVAEVAGFIELGTDDSPPRSFVRAVADGDRGRLEQALARGAEVIARRGADEADDVLEEIGEDAVARMKRRMPVETGTTANAVMAKVHFGGRS